MADAEPKITWSEEGVPFAPAFDDVYCSRSGVAQADLVFVEGSDLPVRFAGGEDVTIVETGLGLGLNLLAAVRAWTRARGGGALRHASIELHPVPPVRLREIHARLGTLDGATEALLEAYPELLDAGAARMRTASGHVDLRLVLGDGAAALRRLDVRADAVFLDGFAPAKNPALWNDDVYAELARLARPGATIASYTAAGAVRAGLDRAGFDVERLDGFARKRHRLAGRRR
ncbi:MAG: tRNA (5-methylaminomethyl-2-thiouridine)(34)-methyltransferase MnmD [Planctomycetota bacterium]